MLTHHNIRDLGAEICRVLPTDVTPTRVEMTEMADGSRRACALVTIIDDKDERTLRFALAAPWNAPAWASARYGTTIVEELDADGDVLRLLVG